MKNLKVLILVVKKPLRIFLHFFKFIRDFFLKIIANLSQHLSGFVFQHYPGIFNAISNNRYIYKLFIKLKRYRKSSYARRKQISQLSSNYTQTISEFDTSVTSHLKNTEDKLKINSAFLLELNCWKLGKRIDE